MVAVPSDIAVTIPFDTVATEVLLLLQVILLSVALLGLIVADKERVSPTSIVSVVLSSDIEVATTVLGFTIILFSRVFLQHFYFYLLLISIYLL